MEWGIGYENTYTYESENGHESTETKEYENGRLKNKIEIRNYENMSWSTTISYEYSGDILTETSVEDSYYKGKLKESTKVVYEYNIDRYGGAHLIKSTSYDFKGNLSGFVEYEYDSEGRKIGENHYLYPDGSFNWSVKWILDEDGRKIKEITYNSEGAVTDERDCSD